MKILRMISPSFPASLSLIKFFKKNHTLDFCREMLFKLLSNFLLSIFEIKGTNRRPNTRYNNRKGENGYLKIKETFISTIPCSFSFICLGIFRENRYLPHRLC